MSVTTVGSPFSIPNVTNNPNVNYFSAMRTGRSGASSTFAYVYEIDTFDAVNPNLTDQTFYFGFMSTTPNGASATFSAPVTFATQSYNWSSGQGNILRVGASAARADGGALVGLQLEQWDPNYNQAYGVNGLPASFQIESVSPNGGVTTLTSPAPNNGDAKLLESIVLLGDGNYLVNWADLTVNNGFVTGATDYTAVIDAAGHTIVGAFQTHASNVIGNMSGEIALSTGGAVEIFATGTIGAQGSASVTGLSGQLLDATGQPIGGNFSITTLPSGVTTNSRVRVAALADGGFMVFWGAESAYPFIATSGSWFINRATYSASGTLISTGNITSGSWSVSAGGVFSGSTLSVMQVTSLANGGVALVMSPAGQYGIPGSSELIYTYDYTGSSTGSFPSSVIPYGGDTAFLLAEDGTILGLNPNNTAGEQFYNFSTNTITAASGFNVIYHMPINQTVIGNGALDTYVFGSYTLSQLTITRNADGTVTVAAPDATDTLSRVQMIQDYTGARKFIGHSTSDFSGDGNSDVLLENTTSGQIGTWEISNNTPVWASFSTEAAGWHAAGSGDFNGDGVSDILLENSSTGAVGTWEITNNTPTWAYFSAEATGWHVAGVGDFNGDGQSDVLLENSSTGVVGTWEITNNTPTWAYFSAEATGWHVAGVGDFNGDGRSDVLLENSTNGIVGAWEITNNTPSWVYFSAEATGWHVTSVGDYNADGKSDILLSNTSTGQVGEWLINNNTPTWQGLSTIAAGWHAVG